MTNYWRLIIYCPDLCLLGGTARKLAVPIFIMYLFIIYLIIAPTVLKSTMRWLVIVIGELSCLETLY